MACGSFVHERPLVCAGAPSSSSKPATCMSATSVVNVLLWRDVRKKPDKEGRRGLVQHESLRMLATVWYRHACCRLRAGQLQDPLGPTWFHLADSSARREMHMRAQVSDTIFAEDTFAWCSKLHIVLLCCDKVFRECEQTAAAYSNMTAEALGPNTAHTLLTSQLRVGSLFRDLTALR